MSLTHKINTSLNSILENKKLISELNTVTLKDTSYPNVKFDTDGTQNDKVNKALLDDLQKAASSAGIVVTITSAKTGHSSKTSSNTASRHAKQTAVDIALINGIGSGNATGPSNGNYRFKLMGDKLKDALVSLGYIWNKESGNVKSVLWQTGLGGNHYNHIHVSNESDSSSYSNDSGSSNVGDTSGNSDSSKSSSPSGDDVIGALGRKFGSGLGGSFVNAFVGESINEQITPKMVGKHVDDSNGYMSVPSNYNKSVSSPVYGVVKFGKDSSSCENEVKIMFTERGQKYYLQYCNLNRVSSSIKNGSPISVGDTIGYLNKDITVSLFDVSGGKKQFGDVRYKSSKSSGSYSDKGSDAFIKGAGRLFSKIVAPFQNKYDESGKMIEKRWGSPTDAEQPEKWIRKMSPTYNSVKENIEKIKKLL
jgi:hypothetical protein